MTEYGRTPAEVAAVRRLRRALGELSTTPPPSPVIDTMSLWSKSCPDHHASATRTELGHRVGVLGALVVAIGVAVLGRSSGRAIGARLLDVAVGALAILAGVLALRVWRDVARTARAEHGVGSRRTIDPVALATFDPSSASTGPSRDTQLAPHAIRTTPERSIASWRGDDGGAAPWISP
jgi:hypothetical protein